MIDLALISRCLSVSAPHVSKPLYGCQAAPPFQDPHFLRRSHVPAIVPALLSGRHRRCPEHLPLPALCSGACEQASVPSGSPRCIGSSGRRMSSWQSNRVIKSKHQAAFPLTCSTLPPCRAAGAELHRYPAAPSA